MTVKELKQECINNGVIYIYLAMDVELFNRFITKLCKEQRKQCMQEYTKGKFRTDIAYNILNAPEPEM